MSEGPDVQIRFGYTINGSLDVHVFESDDILVLNDQAEYYVVYLLQVLKRAGIAFDFYDLVGETIGALSSDFPLVNGRSLVSSVLVYEGEDYLSWSRLVAEAFKVSLSLGEDEFLFLNSILQTLYKQSHNVNLLQVLSSIRSYDSQELSFIERSTASRLNWRFYLISDLMLSLISDKNLELTSKQQTVFDLSKISSIEGRILTFSIEVAKELNNGRKVQIVYLGNLHSNVKVCVIKYMKLIRPFCSAATIVASKPHFPDWLVKNFGLLILDEHSLTLFNKGAKDIRIEPFSHGELLYKRGDSLTPFLFEKPTFKVEGVVSERNVVRDKTVSDIDIAKRIVKLLVVSNNVTRVGLIQSLSVDLPTEVTEYVLQELISLGYIICEVKKTKTGLVTRLTLSMDGRAWASKEGVV
ncbi:MAG: hypothetical protein QXJ17_05745 [Nitrososphaeria archaeon]